jgi:hypothetical protein
MVSLVCVCAKRKGFENEQIHRVGLLTTKSEIFKHTKKNGSSLTWMTTTTTTSLLYIMGKNIINNTNNFHNFIISYNT